MLSPGKFTPLAAIAAAAILFGAAGSMSTASAQTGVQLAQANVSTKTTTKVTTTKRKPAASSQRRATITKKTTTRTVVRSNNNNRRVVVRSNNDRYRYGNRSYAASSVAFVVLGPRVVYRSYGVGWCRGLHSGRHWAPRIGWHRGRHVGAVRCG